MEDGVLVVDGDGHVRLLNPRAAGLLGTKAAAGIELATMSRALAERYRMWCTQPVETVEMLRQGDGRLLRIRYVPSIEPGGACTDLCRGHGEGAITGPAA
jgi:PAS domain-containing protein